MANEFTGIVQRLLNLLRLYTSGISFSGVVTYIAKIMYSENRDGALNLVGEFFRLFDLGRLQSSALDIAGSFTRLLDVKRSASSALGFSGHISNDTQVQQFFTGAISGIISFAGKVIRRLPYSGIVYRLLNLYRTKTSELTLLGSIAYFIGELSTGVYSGTVTTDGSIYRYIVKSLTKTGTLAYSGTIGRFLALFRTTDGALDLSGRVKRTNAKVSHFYDGALSFAGEVVRGLFVIKEGAVTFAGSVSRSAIESVSSVVGDLELIGSRLRTIIVTKSKSGLLTLSGMTTGVKTSVIDYYWAAAGGVLSITGSIDAALNLTSKTVSGALSPIGRITIIDAVLNRISDAGLVISGSLNRAVVTARTTLVGALTLSGVYSILKWFKKSKTGVVSFAGEVVSYTTGGIWNYSANGVLSITGSLSKLYQAFRTYTGALTSSGLLTKFKELLRTYAGNLNFAGSIVATFTSRDWRLGFLGITGTVTPYLVTNRPTYSSTLTIQGLVTRAVTVARSISGVSGFNADAYGYKDILYFGPPNP